MNNEIDQIRSNVPLWRRVGALYLDLLFYSMFLSNYIFHDDWISLIFLTLFIIFDNFVTPYRRSYSFPRWIMGYEIKDSKGNTCTFKSITIRFICIIGPYFLIPITLFNFFTRLFFPYLVTVAILNILLFIIYSTILKGKELPHDILAGTRRIMITPRYRLLRIALPPLITYIAIAFTVHWLCTEIYNSHVHHSVLNWHRKVALTDQFRQEQIDTQSDQLIPLYKSQIFLAANDSIKVRSDSSIVTVNYDSFTYSIFSNEFQYRFLTDTIAYNNIYRQNKKFDCIFGESGTTAETIDFFIENALYSYPIFSLFNIRKSIRDLMRYINASGEILYNYGRIPIRLGTYSGSKPVIFKYHITDKAQHQIIFRIFTENRYHDVVFQQLGELESDASINYIIENIQFNIEKQHQ